jgi:peptidoglycan/LPS O-acetylase OafA/YrhL
VVKGTTTWRLGRRPALDGLRGVAVLLVVASHLRSPWFGSAAGDVGVTVFFVLSGFLIATLLFEELERSGSLSLGSFYRRRARRLLPALVVVVAVSVLITMVSGIGFVTWPEVVGALLYCTNIVQMWVPIQVDGMLHHTWSLVIEEQFYLLWPFVASVLWRRRTLLLVLLLAGSVLVEARRVVLFGVAPLEDIAFSVGTRVDGILIGCALAVVLRGRVLPRPARWSGSLAVGYVLVAALSPVYGLTFVAGLTLAAVATSGVIVAVLADAAPRWLEWSPLRTVGRLSYGLYLWHHVVLVFSDRALGLADDWIATSLVVLPASAVLTWLSWRFVERPRSHRRPGMETHAPVLRRGCPGPWPDRR